MAEIHPTTILEGDVTLADDVVVGPHCVLTGPVTIGAGTRLIGNVYVQGPTTIGCNNTIYPFATLGFAPQSISYDPAKPGRGLRIGDGNTLRESVTVHRAMTDEGPTRLGDGNMLMANSHVGHDSQISNRCILINGALVAGHVQLDDGVILSGNAGVHQFCRMGRGSMLAGIVRVTSNVPPFFTVTEHNMCGSINLVGLRRRGTPGDEIADIRWVYRILYRMGLSLSHAKERLREREDRPMVTEYIQFIESSTRGICTGPQKAKKVKAILRKTQA